MKRYIIYGLVLILIAVAGLFLYKIYGPSELVIEKIPMDVNWCFTVDKKEFFQETLLSEDLEKDSLFQKLKAKLPFDALKIYNTIGINQMGDIAAFGQTEDEINVAWIGKNEKDLTTAIKHNKWPEKKYKHFSEVNISDNLYLEYQWPIALLRNKPAGDDFKFFSSKAKKLNGKQLLHNKTKGSIIYGFIKPSKQFAAKYSFIPLDKIIFIGLKKEDSKINIYFVQPSIKLKGKLGIPQKHPSDIAIISWPLTNEAISSITQIPSAVSARLNQLLTKPFIHFYGEVLDTISTTEEYTQIDWDNEFRLTLKVREKYKAFPGLRMEFIKKAADNSNSSQAINLGLDILKLQFAETSKSYNISSEDKQPRPSEQNIPDYYLYANFDVLQADPFWQPIIENSFKCILLYTKPLDKGSVFVLTLEK